MDTLYEDTRQTLTYDEELGAFRITPKDKPNLVSYYFPENVSQSLEDITNPVHIAMHDYLESVNYWS